MKKPAQFSFAKAASKLSPAIIGLTTLAMMAACARSGTTNTPVTSMTPTQMIEQKLREAGFEYDQTNAENMNLARRLQGATLRIVNPGADPAAGADRQISAEISIVLENETTLIVGQGEIARGASTRMVMISGDPAKYNVETRCLSADCTRVAALLTEIGPAPVAAPAATNTTPPTTAPATTAAARPVGVAATGVEAAEGDGDTASETPSTPAANAPAIPPEQLNQPLQSRKVAMIFSTPGEGAARQQVSVNGPMNLQWSASPVVGQYENGGTRASVEQANLLRVQANRPALVATATQGMLTTMDEIIAAGNSVSQAMVAQDANAPTPTPPPTPEELAAAAAAGTPAAGSTAPAPNASPAPAPSASPAPGTGTPASR